MKIVILAAGIGSRLGNLLLKPFLKSTLKYFKVTLSIDLEMPINLQLKV